MRALALGLSVLLLSACELRDARQAGDPSSGDYFHILYPAELGLGTPASEADIRRLNIDVSPDGAGLPEGRGTYARGAAVYAQQCASCHGTAGEGIPPNPRLVGRDTSNFAFGSNPELARTVGSYWPYATTLFDYVNRTMPFNAPTTLPAGDVYSVVAWLLAENGIVEKSAVMDARSLPQVRMPARDRFVRDDRLGTAEFR